MRYAIIDENNIIQNIIEIEPENAFMFKNAKPFEDGIGGIGEVYQEPVVEKPPTDKERIADLEVLMADMLGGAI